MVWNLVSSRTCVDVGLQRVGHACTCRVIELSQRGSGDVWQLDPGGVGAGCQLRQRRSLARSEKPRSSVVWSTPIFVCGARRFVSCSTTAPLMVVECSGLPKRTGWLLADVPREHDPGSAGSSSAHGRAAENPLWNACGVACRPGGLARPVSRSRALRWRSTSLRDRPAAGP